MRIVCFGDSLALPREGCLYTSTWIARLKSAFPGIDFISNFRGGMLVGDILRDLNYMKYAYADIVIIQEGVCDCSPRYLNDDKFFWKFIIRIVDMTRTTSLFWRLVKCGSRKPSCTYTPIAVFYDKYNVILENMYGGG